MMNDINCFQVCCYGRCWWERFTFHGYDSVGKLQTQWFRDIGRVYQKTKSTLTTVIWWRSVGRHHRHHDRFWKDWSLLCPNLLVN